MKKKERADYKVQRHQAVEDQPARDEKEAADKKARPKKRRMQPIITRRNSKPT